MGNATITAKSGTVVASSTVTVTAGYPATIAKIAGDNLAGTAGASVTVAPQVQVKDSLGNPVDGVPVTFAVATGGGTVTGAAVTTSAGGFASVGSWVLGGTPGTNTLTASTPGTSGNVSAIFTVLSTPSVPAQLVISALPTGAVSGLRMAVPAVVEVRTSTGNLVPSSTTAVTVAAVACGRLSGTTTVIASAGVARFSDLLVLDGGPCQVTFTAPGLTSAGGTFGVEQGVALAGQAVSFSATRGLAEAEGKLIPITSVTGVTVTGLATSIAYNGVASGWLKATLASTSTQASLLVEARLGELLPGSYSATIRVSGTNAAPADIPVTFVVTGQPAVALVAASRPSTGKVGRAFPVTPVIEFRDPGGLVATQVNDVVIARVRSGPGVLTGATAIAAVNGVARFTNLVLSQPGTYVLSFESGTLPVIATGNIVVSYPATGFEVVTAPAGSRGPDPLSTQPVVYIRNNAGELVTDEEFTISLLVVAPSVNQAAVAYTAKTVGGIARFTDVTINGAPATYQFIFTSTTPGFGYWPPININFP